MIFLVFGPREILKEVAPKIREFAWEELGLIVSPSKFYLQPSCHGVKFVGSFIMPGRIYAGNRVRGKLEKVLHQKKPTLETAQHFQAVVNSYLGLFSHTTHLSISGMNFYPTSLHHGGLILKWMKIIGI